MKTSYRQRYKSKAWEQYEAGKEYKRKIGLYSTVRQNERFYRGDQWYANSGEDLPKPVFNIIRRIADYLICSVASSDGLILKADNLHFNSVSLREFGHRYFKEFLKF